MRDPDRVGSRIRRSGATVQRSTCEGKPVYEGPCASGLTPGHGGTVRGPPGRGSPRTKDSDRVGSRIRRSGSAACQSARKEGWYAANNRGRALGSDRTILHFLLLLSYLRELFLGAYRGVPGTDGLPGISGRSDTLIPKMFPFNPFRVLHIGRNMSSSTILKYRLLNSILSSLCLRISGCSAD